jgi:DNA-directed RNA polymerase subunit RPC12/RpoP
MATVDYGIIVRTEDPWIYVKPRCPHCGYLEQSDWNLVIMSPPRMKYAKSTHGYTCRKCWKSFTISAYDG